MTDDELLEKHGWTLECESPLEISHKDGSFARYLPASLLIDHLRELEEEEREQPLSPEDIDTNMENIIPEYVIAVVNKLIKREYRGNPFTIKQDEIVEEIENTYGVDRHTLYDNNYLDFESIYRKRGWIVEYDKPGYNESYAARFEFTPKKK